MLQGFYIFVIFVCKRNIFEAISNRKRGHNTQDGGKLLRNNPTGTIMTRLSRLTTSLGGSKQSFGPNTDPNPRET